jgi:hypothetical protein
MSTCYRTEPEMTIGDVVRVPGLSIVAIEQNALALSSDRGANRLWAYVTDGIVTGYVRYGGNNAAPILNAICQERIIRIICEYDDEFFVDTRDLGPDYEPGDEDLVFV